MNFEGDGIEYYNEFVAAFDRFDLHSKLKRLELDMKNPDSPPAKRLLKRIQKRILSFYHRT